MGSPGFRRSASSGRSAGRGGRRKFSVLLLSDALAVGSHRTAEDDDDPIADDDAIVVVAFTLAVAPTRLAPV